MAIKNSIFMFKKWDVIIIIFLIIISFIPEGILLLSGMKKYDSKYIEISINGSIYKKIDLDSPKEEIIEISGDEGVNILKIYNGQAQIIDADCDDRVCINFGAISRIGESIVCLPHKVVISIKGKSLEEENDIILAY